MSTLTAKLHIQLFGILGLTVNGEALTTVKSERLQALLAFLLLHRDSPQPRQHIAAQLWPDVRDTEAKANLRRRLHELKQYLGDRHLQITQKTVQWVQDETYCLDVAEFESALADPAVLSDAQALQQAVDLYQGDLLPSCYDDWIMPIRDQLHQQAITALDQLVPLLAAQDQVRSALKYAKKLQHLDPLYEPAYCHLMRLHGQAGDRASALRVYHLCMTVLQEELGVPPSPSTAKLYEELLTLEDRPDADDSDDGRSPTLSSAERQSKPPATEHQSKTPVAEHQSKASVAERQPKPSVAERQSKASVAELQPKPPIACATSTIYIERPPLETRCHDALLQPGALVRVKSPSLMGKTLMMDRVLSQLAGEDCRTVRLSMEMADRSTHFSDLNRFLRWMSINISRRLGIPHQIDEYWDEEGMGSKVSCSTYMEEYVLPTGDTPLVLCLDDIDVLFAYPNIYEDVFGLLRSWYELARTYTCPIWTQLRLAIVHATDVYVPLNIHQSPFNVGVPMELPDFTLDQVQALAELSLPGSQALSEADVVALMNMVGGHPYLLQQAFEVLKGHPDQDLAKLLALAPTDSGIYASHLRDCWLDIREQTELKEMLGTVVMAEDEPVALDSILAHQLHSMGLIRLQGNLAEPRCELYRRYFCGILQSADG